MDLAELRINRTPVTQNSKCEGCVHYDGNAQAKAGACEVGQQPALCGSGNDRRYGYAPLAELGPDEIDDLATPCVHGASGVGAMNEHGAIEKTIMMKRVCLGDEDFTIAERIHGVIEKETRKSIGYAQGQIALHCGAEMAQQLYDKPLPTAYVVAKSLRDMHMEPRKQRKYDLGDVLDFLKSRGMEVGSDAYAAAGIVKSEGSRGGHVVGHTRTGKPIYGPNQAIITASKNSRNTFAGGNSAQAVSEHAESHAKADERYTPEDHAEAADRHRALASMHKKEHEDESGPDVLGNYRADQVHAHLNIAHQHDRAAGDAKAPEGHSSYGGARMSKETYNSRHGSKVKKSIPNVTRLR